MKDLIKIKKDTEIKISELRHKRKDIVNNFRKKTEEIKINQIKKSILNN